MLKIRLQRSFFIKSMLIVDVRAWSTCIPRNDWGWGYFGVKYSIYRRNVQRNIFLEIEQYFVRSVRVWTGQVESGKFLVSPCVICQQSETWAEGKIQFGWVIGCAVTVSGPIMQMNVYL